MFPFSDRGSVRAVEFGSRIMKHVQKKRAMKILEDKDRQVRGQRSKDRQVRGQRSNAITEGSLPKKHIIVHTRTVPIASLVVLIVIVMVYIFETVAPGVEC